MKKIRFLIMTVLLILVFTGCEQPAKPKKFDSSAQTEAVKKTETNIHGSNRKYYRCSL